MSILKQLYDGKIFPCETIMPQNQPGYRAAAGKVCDDYDYFIKTLPPEQAKRFEEMDRENLKTSSMQAYANFEYGFKLGALLMSEVLSGHGETKE